MDIQTVTNDSASASGAVLVTRPSPVIPRALLAPHPPPLAPRQVGMLTFLVSEAAFFCTLIVVYIACLGGDQSGPTPAVLSLPLVIGTTICLLSSSVTV